METRRDRIEGVVLEAMSGNTIFVRLYRLDDINKDLTYHQLERVRINGYREYEKDSYADGLARRQLNERLQNEQIELEVIGRQKDNFLLCDIVKMKITV